MLRGKIFICYFYFVGWDCVSIGLHLCLSEPNIEIHIPFGFIRAGFTMQPERLPVNYLAIGVSADEAACAEYMDFWDRHGHENRHL